MRINSKRKSSYVRAEDDQMLNPENSRNKILNVKTKMKDLSSTLRSSLALVQAGNT